MAGNSNCVATGTIRPLAGLLVTVRCLQRARAVVLCVCTHRAADVKMTSYLILPGSPP